MSDASTFPITELYGCQPGYPLNSNMCPPGQGFHKGIDYGCPVGTPIVVNRVTIGISGATGAVTGPHVHVGRWVNGQSTDPGVGNGWKFNSAVVTEIGSDPTNGNFVRVQGDGASWVYLHMSDNSKVKVDQVLQGGDMPTEAEVRSVFQTYQMGTPTAKQISDYTSSPWERLLNDVIHYMSDRTFVNEGDLDNWYPKWIGRAPNANDITTWKGKYIKDCVYDAISRPDAIWNNPPNAQVLKPGTYKVN